MTIITILMMIHRLGGHLIIPDHPTNFSMESLDLESELSPETFAALKEFLQERELKIINHNDEDWEFCYILSVFYM